MRTPQRQYSSSSISKYNPTMHGEMLISAPTSSMFDRRMKMERPMTFTNDSSGFDSETYHTLMEPFDYAHSPLPLPPHISLHHPSEPPSPITVASTLSHTSSPSPSPSRGVAVSDPMSADFLLFDDSMRTSPMTHPQKRIQGGHRRFGSASSLGSDTGAPSTSNPSQFQHNIYPVIAQTDSFSQAGFGGNYMMQQDPSTLIDLSKQTPKSTQQHLRPPFQFNGNQNLSAAQMLMQHNGQSDDDEPVPGLSPASRNAQFHSGRPSVSSDGFRSPRSPTRTPDFHQETTHTTPRIYTSQQAPVTPHMHNTEIQGMSFPNIFQKAQQAHAIDQTSPVKNISRDRSPFRMSSPYHSNMDVSHDMSILYPVRIATAHDQRVKQQQEFAAAEVLRKQMEAEAASAETPKTISPKDAMLEYHEPDNHKESQGFFENVANDRTPMNYSDIYSTTPFYPAHGDNETEASFGSMATSRRESSSAMSNASLYRTTSNQIAFGGVQAPVQAYNRTSSNQMHTLGPIQHETQQVPPAVTKPTTKANAGTYTCTAESCGQRFTTSAKLQRHRREAHRLSTPGVAPGIGSGMSSAAVAARNAQPGPHKCNRVNPSTGKPCNIVFSRPYDLTRHEDTIHNNVKEKVRCEICTDEKTFSRYDALVRHKRVKHGIVDRH